MKRSSLSELTRKRTHSQLEVMWFCGSTSSQASVSMSPGIPSLAVSLLHVRWPNGSSAYCRPHQ
eukprot:4334415-Amphidinium_carterae.2